MASVQCSTFSSIQTLPLTVTICSTARRGDIAKYAVGQVAPHEHHCGAGRGGENDAAGDGLVGVGRRPTLRIDPKSTLIIIGVIISQMRLAIGTLI